MLFFNSRKDRSSSKQARGVRRPIPRRKQLSLETLEDRAVPSTVKWINPNGGDWSTAANWFGGVVPNVTQDAIINIAVSGPITIDSAVAVHSLTDTTASLDLTGGSLSLVAASSVSQNVTISSGGVLTASGSLTVGGALSESGGVLTGSGTVTVDGLLTWTGGAMSGSGTTLADGGLQLGADDGNSYSESLDARTLQNAGSATLASTDTFNQNANSIFVNLAQGTLIVQSGATTNSGGTLDNQGTLSVEAGTGTATFNDFFSNEGSVQVSSGTLFLAAGGNVTGTVTVATGATLQFGGSQYVFNSGASLSGSGTVDFGAPFAHSATIFDAGSSYNVAGTTSVQDGDSVVFDAAASTGTLNQSSGTLGGSATLTVTGMTTWTNGTMTGSGTTDALGGLALGASGDTGDSVELAGRTLINAGAGVWYGSETLTQEENSTFLNQAGATLQIEAGANWSYDDLAADGSGTFDNQGALTVADGSDTTLVETYFIDAGPVQVNSGTFQLGDGGAVTGSFSVASGATLLLGNNYNYEAYTFSSGASLSGAGAVDFGSGVAANFAAGSTYNVTGSTTIDTGGNDNSNVVFTAGSTVEPLNSLTIETGVVNFSTGATITAASLNLDSGGTLTGSDTLDVSGLTTWIDGEMCGTGETVAEGGLALGLADGAYHDEQIFSRTLINQATANWVGSGEIDLYAGGTFVNQAGATFSEQAPDTIWDEVGVGLAPSGLFDNQGTFEVASGATAGMEAGFDNEGQVEIISGIWELSGDGASSGTITLDSGTSLQLNMHYGISYTTNEDGTFDSSPLIIGGSDSNVTLIDGSQTVPTALGNTEVIPMPTTPFTSFYEETGDDTISSLTMTDGYLIVDGTLTVTGPMVWDGGYIVGPGEIIAEGGLTLGEVSGDQQDLYGATLVNAGAATLFGAAEIGLEDGATIINQQGASLAIQGGGSGVQSDGTAILFNQGSITAAVGSGTTETIDYVSLVNSGSVSVTSGTLNLEGGGTSTGGFSAASGATLEFGHSYWAFNAGSSVSGAGTVDFDYNYWNSNFASGSTYNVSGATEVQSQTPVNFLSGSDAENLGALSLINGTLQFDTGSPVSAASLNESGGVLNGSDTVTVSGLTTWTAGVMSGTGATVAAGGLQIGASDTSDAEYLTVRTLDAAAGGTLESKDTLIELYGATFVNPASATFNVQDDVNWYNNGDGTSTIDNQGMLDVAAGSGTAAINGSGYLFFLINTGGIEVGSGTLALACPGTASGSFTVDSGATLQFSGDFTLGTGSSVSGAGIVEVPGGDVWVTSGASYNVAGTTTIDGGALEIDGSAVTGTLNESSGSDLTGPGTLTVSTLTVWTGGTMDGAGATVAEGSLQIGQAGAADDVEELDGRTLSNAGAATWAGGGSINQNYGGTFVNEANASFTIDNDLNWYSDGTGTFANAGSLVMSAGTGATTLDVALDNTGSVQVQQGTLSLQGGGIVGGSYLVLAGATLTFANDNVTTTSVALPSDFTAGPLNWNGTFSGSAQDNSGSGLASVGVSLFNGNDYYDGTAFESPTAVFNAGALSGNSWTYSIPTSIFTNDLAYAVGSQATDNDGGAEPSSITSILLAPLPATVTAVAPATGPIAGGTQVTITGTGLANATAVDFGATPATIVSDTNTTIVVMSPSTEEAGSVDVTVTTADGASATSPADKFTYTNPPSSSVAALPVYETSATFTISWSGTDSNPGAAITGYTIFVSFNDGPFTSFLTNTMQTSTTFTGQNGNTYGFYSVATDNEGNVQPTPSAAQATTTVDTVAPTVSMTSPVNGSDTNINKPALSASVSTTGDISGLASVQFQYSINGGTSWINAGAIETGAPFSFTFSTALPDGTYEARAVATDNAGNSATSTPVSFLIDTVAPTVSMTSPVNGSDTNNTEPTLSASVSTTGDPSGLASVQFQYSSNGGSTWTNAGSPETAAPFSFTFSTALADGDYQARAVATDNAGNSATSTAVSYLIDTVAPTVTMTSPVNGSDSSNTKPTLTATASDNPGGSGLASVQFQYSNNGGTTWTNAGSPESTAPFSFTFTTALAAGTYEARAVATDNAGNSTTSTPVSFGVNVVQSSTTLSNSPGATVALGSGSKLTDSATLAKGSKPTGTITFTLYAPNGKTIVDTETATVNGNGTYKTATGYLPSAAGTYEWVASYSGDGANKAVSSAKGAEKVSLATPTLSTTPDGPVVVGSQTRVTDSATLSGGDSPTGTIIFDLSAPNGRSVDTESVKVNGDGTYSTPAGYLPSTAGTYKWVVSYSGDSNNEGVSSSLGSEPVTVIGSGVTVAGKDLYVVGGSGDDHIQIVAYGSSTTGSTGVKINADLNGLSVAKTYGQSFTSIYVFGFSGNDSVQMANSLTVATVVTLGNGNDSVQLGGGNNSVTVGNGNDYVQVGNGINVVVAGNGTDSILAGNGDNLIAAGLGEHTVVVGNGSNILIDGSVQVTQSDVTLAQVLSDWTEFGSASSNVATIHSLLAVTDNSSNPNTLVAGSGLDWFWETFGQDTTNKKATDLLN